MRIKEKTFDDYKKETFAKNPTIYKEYKRLEPRYEIIKEILNYRIKQNISQKELALKIGTKQSSISRFENGEGNITLNFLQKIANVLNKEIHISFK
jgi:predicted transcriptional regulator